MSEVLIFPNKNVGQFDDAEVASSNNKIQISEVRTFMNEENGAQLIVLYDTNSKCVKMMKGSAYFPVMTQQGPRGVQVEIDFPVEDVESSHNPEMDLMYHVRNAFSNYDHLAQKAVEEKQKEIENQNRIVTPSGLPFNPKGNPKGNGLII